LKLTFQVSDVEEPESEIDEEGNEIASELDVLENVPPMPVSLTVSKSASPSVLRIDLDATPEGFEISNIAVFDKSVAEGEGAEADWRRRSQYTGPRES
jgi:complement component 1 Q subcomponent-binding protein